MRRARARGFTLIELVVTLGVMVTLAALAAPRFLDMTSAYSLGAQRRLAADIRYAQRLAMAKSTTCGVIVNNAGQYTVFEGTTTEPADDLLTGDFIVVLGDSFPGVAVSPVGGTVTFDARGRPKSGSTLAFTIGGGAVTVASETGAVTR